MVPGAARSLPIGMSIYDSYRERSLFLYSSMIGGDAYKNPPQSPLSTAQVYEVRVNSSGSIYDTLAGTCNSYLVPHQSEKLRDFKNRHAVSSYINIVEPIVKAYSDAVTSNVRRDLGTINSFIKEVDYHEQDWSGFVESQARFTALYGFMFTVVDTDGVQPKAIQVHPHQVAFADVGPTGKLTSFAYCTDTFIASAGTQVVTIRLYNQDGWYDLQGKINISEGINSQRDKLEIVNQGPLPLSTGELPILVSYYSKDTTNRYPYGYSLVDDTADHAREIYNLSSLLYDINRKAMFPQLTMPIHSERGSLSTQTKLEVGTGRVLTYNSDGGSPSFISPSTEPTRELREHIKEKIVLAFRLKSLDVGIDQSVQESSGIQLRIKRADFESRAKSFANNMLSYELKLARLFAVMGGVSETGISIEYPKSFTLPDVSEQIANALSVIGMDKAEIGPTARVEATMKVLTSALGLSDALSDKIRTEIETHEKGVYADYNLFRQVKTTEAKGQLDSMAPQDAAPVAPPSKDVVLYAYDYESGIVTVNEARSFKGLPPIDGGNVPVAVWLASFKANETAQVTAAEVGAQDGGATTAPASGPVPAASDGASGPELVNGGQ